MRKATEQKSKYLLWMWFVLGLLFGAATIRSGGQVLFGGTSFRQAAGNYVSFVLWFNFIAGFVYLLAAAGLLLQKKASAYLPGILAASNLIVLLALGIHIYQGGAYEMRTLYAMGLRTVFWSLVFAFTYRRFWKA